VEVVVVVDVNSYQIMLNEKDQQSIHPGLHTGEKSASYIACCHLSLVDWIFHVTTHI